MKLNRKQANWYILLLAATCFVILFFTNNNHSISYTNDYIIDEPWRKDLNIYSMDNFRIYLNYILGLYHNFPWQLQLSYLVIVSSIISIIVLMYVMSWDVYNRNKEKRIYNFLRDKYYNTIKDFITGPEVPVPEYLTNISLTRGQTIIFLNLLIEIRMETDINRETVSKIQNLVKQMGLYDFMEKHLLEGSINDKIKVIQTIRMLHMEISDSTMVRFVNDKNHELRKAARLYYILSSKEDPFKYFSSYDNKHNSILPWDMLEIHQILKEYRTMGKSLPSLVPALNNIQDKSATAFFIKEIAYWGSEKEVGYLRKFISSEEEPVRVAAMRALAMRHDKNIMEIIKNSFYTQNENVKRESLLSLLEAGGESSIVFFEEAYMNTSSRLTRKTALHCLWNSGEKGKTVFHKLKDKASAQEEVLFRHVESN